MACMRVVGISGQAMRTCWASVGKPRIRWGRHWASPEHVLSIGGQASCESWASVAKPHVRWGHRWVSPLRAGGVGGQAQVRIRASCAPVSGYRSLISGISVAVGDHHLNMVEAKSLMHQNALANADNCRVRVTCRSSIITCIKDIAEKFLEDLNKSSRFKRRQLKTFENSYFGTLYLIMQEIILSGGIVHNMIVRQAESINKDVMEFKFNGKGAIFTKREFEFVMGLKMENSLDVPPLPHSN
ncbi:hypothetical protein FNV43_RR13063 [Rhamnella rubrinervis]|uniref:Uncharacterized protein n=1 Tax=Rhamnella rubrinervis TaxID=2594499 RepID=A0A8K0H0E2_9ROSA|nr:hypothetical protein FNV43_RR13063 [Rhamnella rubrinervis]